MKKVNTKFLIISVIYITSFLLIGWVGVNFPINHEAKIDRNRSNESLNLPMQDNPIIHSERSLDYSDIFNQELPERSTNLPATDEGTLFPEFVSIDKPSFSIESVQYISHSVVSINNNDDFTRLNLTGKGTAEDPYQITDFEITANTTHLISIRDTTAYFNISNCQLNGISGTYDGIYLENVINGNIVSNEIFSCSYGIRMFDSSNMNITANTVYDNNLNGIYLVRSSSILMESNVVYWNVHGISLTDSWNNKINRNWVESNTKNGLALFNSSYVDIKENSAAGNSWKGIVDSISLNNSYIANNASLNGNDGIYIYNCNNTKIISNSAGGNTWNGIVLQGNSVNAFISQNYVYNNPNVGLRLENLSFSTIETNYIHQNTEHGIWLHNSQNNIIRNNDVYKNQLDGIYLEDGSDGNTIQENILEENKHGIRIDNSTNNIIRLNRIDFSTAQGILVLTAENIEIKDNQIRDSWGSGMWLSNINFGIVHNNGLFKNSRASIGDPNLAGSGITAAGFGGNISGNVFGSNYYFGMFIMDSGEHDISHNVIINNSDTGLFLQSVTGATINDNEVVGNLGNGMLLNESHSNQILYNVITQNGANGISLINSNTNFIHYNEIYENFGSTISAPLQYVQFSLENFEENIVVDLIDYSVMGSTSGHGIFLDPSWGNKIEFNSLYNNFGSGAYFFESDSNEFNYNVVSENGENGVFLENSNDNMLGRNTIIGNGIALEKVGIFDGEIKFSIQGSTSGHGIFLDPSNGNEVFDNEISHNLNNGISLFLSNNSILRGNTVTKNFNGIYLEDSSWNNISHNIVAKNGEPPLGDFYGESNIRFSITGSTSGHGIFLDPSFHNTITDNTVFGNEGLGLYLMDSDETTIKGNVFSVNRLYAIFADLNSDETLVTQNDFWGNNWVFDDGNHDDGLIRDDGEHGDSQVRDDGNHGDFTGNYWNDLVGDIYYLAGSAENSDTQPSPVPFFPPGYEFTAPTIVFPNGGETLTGVVTIQWQNTSNEKYPENIGYYVFYSSDAGEKWFIIPFDKITITTDSTGQKLLNIVWDTTQGVDGSEYLIKVVAVDEIGSVVSDTSDNVFNIKNGIESTTTTTTRTTETSTPTITPAWTMMGSLLSLGSFGWLSLRKRRRNQ